jgi:hypothetical protein
MEANGERKASADFPPGKLFRNPLNVSLGVPQNQSCPLQKIFFVPTGNRTPVPRSSSSYRDWGIPA